MFEPIDDIYNHLSDYAASEVSIHGRVVISGQDKAYLAADYDAFERGARIEICDNKAIARELLAQLPAYGGGGCLYDEEVWITGTLKETGKGFCVASLTYCMVRRDEVELLVICD